MPIIATGASSRHRPPASRTRASLASFQSRSESIRTPSRSKITAAGITLSSVMTAAIVASFASKPPGRAGTPSRPRRGAQLRRLGEAALIDIPDVQNKAGTGSIWPRLAGRAPESGRLPPGRHPRPPGPAQIRPAAAGGTARARTPRPALTVERSPKGPEESVMAARPGAVTLFEPAGVVAVAGSSCRADCSWSADSSASRKLALHSEAGARALLP